MASQFNQFDWYWDVLDTNHGTHVYSSRVGNFILVSDPTYTAWLAADGGNLPTIIDTFASLCGVLNQFAKLNYVAAATSYTVTANITLPNPLANFIDFINNTSTIFKLILPAANTTIGVPVGVPVTFRNLSSGGGAAACTIYLNDGTTLLAQVDPGTTTTILLKNNNSYNGVWDARNAGNVNNSGTPTTGQYAKWVNALTIQGVNAATVLSDVGGQPLDAQLTALATVSGGADQVPYFTGTATAGQFNASGFSRGLMANVSAPAWLTALGGIGISGTPAANDVAQWVSSTTIKGVSLATWRTTPTFYNILNVLSAAGGDGVYLRGLSGQGLVYAEGASADVGLGLSSKGNASVTFYNGNFGRICAQFNSGPTANTFPTFTGLLNYSTLGNNPTGNPIVMTSVMRLLGVVDGSAAPSGVVGEYIESAIGSSVAMPAATWTAIQSLTLPAGDWDLTGIITNVSAVGANTHYYMNINTTAGSGAAAIYGALINGYAGPAGEIYRRLPGVRVNITTSTTYYINAYTAAAGGSIKGQLYARRAR